MERIKEGELRLKQLNDEKRIVLNRQKEQIIYKQNLERELLAIEKPRGLGVECCEPVIIDRLIQLIKSGQADSVKEALNLYEEEIHKEVMIALQEEQIRLGQQLTVQQS